MATPADPGALYSLTWEDPSDRSLPVRPQGWRADYPQRKLGPPPVTIYDSPFCRPGWRMDVPPWLLDAARRLPLSAASRATSRARQTARQLLGGPLALPRSGCYGVRFDLFSDDPVTSGSVRAELAAVCCEPLEAERWYGFSVYLLDWQWYGDGDRDIVAQWHHKDGNNSPPLSIGTVSSGTANGPKAIDWEIVQYHDDGEQSRLLAGPCALNRWTDWVVHAVWRPAGGQDAMIEIWKRTPLSPRWGSVAKNAGPTHDPTKLIADGQKNTYRKWSNGNDFASDEGHYMKFGIYKWPWNPPQTAGKQRALLCDELRISAIGGAGGFKAVAPPR